MDERDGQNFALCIIYTKYGFLEMVDFRRTLIWLLKTMGNIDVIMDGKPRVRFPMKIETEREEDGRWIAEVPDLPNENY